MTTENKYHSRVGDDNIYQAQEGEYLIVSDIPPSRAHLHEGLGIYELGLIGLSVSLYLDSIVPSLSLSGQPRIKPSVICQTLSVFS